ncbi:MAG: hypothetical protein ACYTAF_05135, partial [Planctomycetota bacterium]
MNRWLPILLGASTAALFLTTAVVVLSESAEVPTGEPPPSAPHRDGSFAAMQTGHGQLHLILSKKKGALRGQLHVIDQYSGQVDTSQSIGHGAREFILSLPAGKKWLAVIPSSGHAPSGNEIEIEEGVRHEVVLHPSPCAR